MTRTPWLVLFAALVGACGGASTVADGGTETGDGGETGETGGEGFTPPTPWQSGERLRAVLVEDGDGIAQHVGWWDRELEIECRFMAVDDGVRCLPSARDVATSRQTEVSRLEWVYADPECTAPALLLQDPCLSPPGMVTTRRDDDTCPRRHDVWRLGDVLPGGQAYGLSGEESVCEPIDLASTSRVYEVEAADLESFAWAKVVDEYAEGEIGTRGYQSLGGAWEAFSLVVDGTACALGSGQEQGACAPTPSLRVMSGEYYPTDECVGEPVAVAELPGCAEPEELVIAQPGPTADCSTEWGYRQAGPWVADEFVWDASSSCFFGVGSPGAKYYELGPSIPAEAFAQVESFQLTEGVTGTWTGPAERPLIQEASFWRAEGRRGSVLSVGGGYRLLPTEGVLGPQYPYFADDECTEPLWPAANELEVCGVELPSRLRRYPSGCEEDGLFLPAPYEGPVYWESTNDGLTCELYDPASTLEFAVLGEAITQQLPELTKRIE